MTVATSVAGRGTDIVVDPTIRQRGGLHVIVFGPSHSTRVDRQLIGRTARGGDPGSYRLYLSADDSLAEKDAPWIGRSIRRSLGAEDSQITSEDFSSEINKQVRQAQRRLESLAKAKRWRLWESDQRQQHILSGRSSYHALS